MSAQESPQTSSRSPIWLIAGSGIGGLSAAVALAQAGRSVRVLERAPEISEVGAGIQLGPNAVRVVQSLGLMDELARVAWFPKSIEALCAESGRSLAELDVRGHAQRYGCPYATVHRADLQALLLARARQVAHVRTGCEVTGFEALPDGVEVHLNTATGPESLQGHALIGADGLWSRLRAQMLGEAPPQFTGDVAYRALVRMADLPAALRQQKVQVWMGPRIHVVAYPVRSGEWLNVVVIQGGVVTSGAQGWSATAPREQVAHMSNGLTARLRDVLEAVSALHPWQAWALHVRPSLEAVQYVQGRVALLGDAAHPMRPYMAQGAAMALEDAWQLGQSVSALADVPEALRQYAQARAGRNARVQETSRKNGEVFHAKGPMRLARNLALAAAGGRLMDKPWLYGHKA
jgi:salicylate hydroxylase